MEEGLEKSSGPKRDRRWRREAGPILVLLLFTGGIHAWLIYHTELPARDGVGFMRYAWRLQHEPWGDVLRTSHQHPGYPLTIAAVSKLLPFGSLSLCDRMLLSAQLVNLAAGCLLAVAMFYLGKELFNPRVGFWTAALFQCLPVAARVTSDALSEAIFLLTATVTLLLAVRSLRDYSIWRLGLCGACGGCCFLIRPEGAGPVVAVLAVLLGLQAVARWRRPWRQVLPAAASLTVAAALVASPYVAVLGNLTNKPTGQAVIGLAQRKIEDGGLRIEDRGTKINRSFDLQSSVFDPQHLVWGVWWHGDREGDWLEHLAWGAWAVTEEVVRGFAYFFLLPAILGLYWFRGQWRNRPEICILGILCLLQALILCRVGLVVGYVSERHVLIIVLCGLYWAVWAVLTLPQRWWLAKNPELRIEDRRSNIEDCKEPSSSILNPQSSILDPRSSILPISILVIFMLACLPVCLQPLHAGQVGHREAGLWLALHTQPGDIIVDPFDWSSLYAGSVFQHETPVAGLSNQRPVQYVVLEANCKPHPELILLPIAKKLAADGQIVFDWQPNRRQLAHKAQEVQIFVVPLQCHYGPLSPFRLSKDKKD